MKETTPRERGLRLVAAIVIAFGILGLFSRRQLDNFRLNRQQLERERATLKFERQMIAAKPDLQRQYDELRTLMPVFKPDKAVDTHWLSIMDDIASKQHLNISRRQAGREEQSGEVYEFAIECREWDGRLDSLVHFLYDLEREGVMLDVRHLYVRPHQSAPGFLRGSFTLYCAYMRDENASESSPSTVVGNESDANPNTDASLSNATVATNATFETTSATATSLSNRLNRIRHRTAHGNTNRVSAAIQEASHE